MNFVSFLLEKSRLQEKPFILGDPETLSYPDLVKNLDRISLSLYNRYGTGKRILIMADNNPFFILGYLSVIYSGNTAVLAETRSNKNDLVQIRTDGELTAAFIQEKYLPNFEGSGLEIISETGIDRFFDNAGPGYSLPVVDDDDIAVIIFTSGSTGAKKGVMLTHKNLIANTSSIISYLGLTESDRICVVLPFFYCYGASLLHTHIRVGGSMVINRKPFLGSVIRDIDSYQCTGFAGVPSTYQILINKTPFLKQEFPSLRYMTQAGGQLPEKYIRMLAESFPKKKIFIMYGATEATARLSCLPPELLAGKPGSIGKGIPGVTLTVLNDDGVPVKPGEVGEIAARGDNIMKGYYRDPDGTAAVLKNGWLYTGDLATVDDDGFIFITGRSKNIIKSGGYRISPHEVEREILSVEKVNGCVVIGMPDEIMGEAVVAVIQLSPAADPPRIRDEIITRCNQRLPSYKMPRKIVFVEQYPLNSSSKIDVIKLREIILAAEK
jgi:long-chain acyl-CoA synthetase